MRSAEPRHPELVLPPGEDLLTCVKRQLPEDSFYLDVDVSWLCETTDPRTGYSQMRTALVLASRGRVTPAMKVWSRVRWYGMASFAVIRASCCIKPSPLELPATASCGSTADLLNEIETIVVERSDYRPVLERYTRNVYCHSNQDRAVFFGLDGRLGGGEVTAFHQLMAQRRAPPATP